MTTNATIKTALFQALDDAGLGYTIAWEGVDFTPPSTGIWLQPVHIPNIGAQPGLANDASEYKNGIFQVDVYTRPGTGIIGLALAAESVAAAFPRGTQISGPIRVTRSRTGRVFPEDDRIFIPVTIEYAGS